MVYPISRIIRFICCHTSFSDMLDYDGDAENACLDWFHLKNSTSYLRLIETKSFRQVQFRPVASLGIKLPQSLEAMTKNPRNSLMRPRSRQGPASKSPEISSSAKLTFILRLLLSRTRSLADHTYFSSVETFSPAIRPRNYVFLRRPSRQSWTAPYRSLGIGGCLYEITRG